MRTGTIAPWAAGVLAAAALAASTPASASPAPATDGKSAAEAMISPDVVKTKSSPTGYEVSFRISDPDASRMRIKGEWYFSSEAASSPTTSEGRLPTEWQPGDFPLAFPAATAANWPVYDMVKDDEGVWSFTTPLPSGVFTYQFFRNCDATPPQLSGCTPMADPANPPWNASGSIERTSQVYVPSDKRFGTEDYSWQSPAPVGHRGTLSNVNYPSPLSTNPVGSHDLAVYLPPGYDSARETPYPLFILSHGGGGNEIDWSTQGVMANIIDKLIAAGAVQPMVVVNTNFNNLTGGAFGYAPDVLDAVIPFVQANFNVSSEASGLAFAGLSAGGARGNQLLFNHTEEFGYYGIWSTGGNPPVPPVGDPVYDNPELNELLGLHIAAGKQDPIFPNTQTEIAGLTDAGVPFTSYLINGGHNWHLWRNALRDFLTHVAFRTTTTSVEATATPAGVTLRAVVDPATDGPADPTGTVQFLVNGQPFGSPRPLHSGETTLTIPAIQLPSGAVSYGADYAGDQYYEPSSTHSS